MTRKDAARNRDRLLIAARQMFAEHGHDVALEEIAQAAGVSRTTIYRNFATREELAATVFADNVAQIEQHAAGLREQPDGAVKLFDFVLDMQLDNRGLAQVLSSADLEWFIEHARRIAASFEPLLDRGRAAGIVQPVVDVDDLMLAISMGEGAVAYDPAQRDNRHKRVREMLHRALFTR
ncbi:regulatory protein, tetR family [Nonomuraea solani]|uniref:Regulatory protein, tetR family n=1 Tax=Nonomuraea solani TaxID=1144553 RepID=A0A1H6EYN4_9ACTN|nr:TetR/AcrR family transcriptional regulator [Nonomuraea solani]SEH02201.1 regulatory protein, tetR family [Nonomuraea solani]